MKFILGTHQPHWVAKDEIAARNAALFISRSTLIRLKSYHRARVPWHMDSGGFTQLQKYGRWTVSPEDFAADARRFTAGMGPAVNYFPRDCMCEPWVIFGRDNVPPNHPLWFHGTHEMRGCKPGSRDDNIDTAVAIHQRMTAEDGVNLRRIAPDLPWRYVLQGWTVDHYLQHIDMYRYDYGIDLAEEAVVGLGSVCRRQATDEIGQIVTAICEKVPGIRLHGFGVAIEGYRKYGHLLHTGDSQSWSRAARNAKLQLPGCTTHKNCANCVHWALIWRDKVLATIAAGQAQTENETTEWKVAA